MTRRDRYLDGECEVCGIGMCEPDELDDEGYWCGCAPTRCDAHLRAEWDDEAGLWVDPDTDRRWDADGFEVEETWDGAWDDAREGAPKAQQEHSGAGEGVVD